MTKDEVLKFLNWVNKNYTNSAIPGTYTKVGRWVLIGDIDNKTITTKRLLKIYQTKRKRNG